MYGKVLEQTRQQKNADRGNNSAAESSQQLRPVRFNIFHNPETGFFSHEDPLSIIKASLAFTEYEAYFSMYSNNQCRK